MVDVSYTFSNPAQRWLGMDMDGVLTVTVRNDAALRHKGSVGLALVDGRTIELPAAVVRSGSTETVRTRVNLSGIRFAERDITVSTATTQVTATLHTVPWGLIALIVVAINVVLVLARDQLRAIVRRQVQRRPARV